MGISVDDNPHQMPASSRKRRYFTSESGLTSATRAISFSCSYVRALE
jgi:hypothetical protein